MASIVAMAMLATSAHAPLPTRRGDSQGGFDLFSHQRDGVLKVALYPDATRVQGGREVVGVGVADEQY
jgi:hypothetical protein